MKKLIALMVCAVIAFSCSATAFAAEGEDYPMLNVPQIRIVTEEGNGTALQKSDGYVNATVSITGTDGSVLEDAVQFKVRGNTTAMESIKKKAFTFKFEKKKDVLGLGKGKKWALIANAFDPTLLRNYIANDIAHEFGLEYTSEHTFVELWVDGSYRGCYDLFEPVQEGKDRVNIDIESNDGMKDFLIEYEAQRVEDDVTYFTVDGLRFISSEPEEPNEDQLAYVTDTMQEIVTALRTGDREDIEELVDIDSFAKYYLLNEYVKTFDFDMSSVFFYYKDGMLYAGPAWDYDLSAGNTNDKLNNYRYKEANPTDGLYQNNKNIYKYICDKEWFMDEVKRVYREHYGYLSTIYTDGGLMDRIYTEYSDVIDRNFTTIWRPSNWWINIQKQPQATYKANYDYLKNWYKERDEWLTGYFDILADAYYIGDSDNDSDITVLDATAIQRYLAGFSVSSFSEAAADANANGDIDILDATTIQRWLVGLPTGGHVGKLTPYIS